MFKLGKSVMSESELHEMDDNLPRMLLNVANLLKTLEVNRIDLFIAPRYRIDASRLLWKKK